MGCCDKKTPAPKHGSHEARDAVREGYAQIARDGAERGCCCDKEGADSLAREVGYTEGELAALPEGANMGLSCGNPTAIASLTEGETVVDLGSGGGFDAFVAARKVGPTGRSIGVDMTPEMITKARANSECFRETTGLDNCEFRLGEIEHLPLADASVDCVISNCVINLSPDKPQVWREIARVLKPGGRVAVSDQALLQPLPEAIRAMTVALIGCVAGAVLVEETERMAAEAGLSDIRLEAKSDYVDKMAQLKGERYREILEALPEGVSLSHYVTSLYVHARKSGCCCR